MRISLFREKENEEEEERLRIDTEESKEENEGLDPIKDSLFAESPIDFKCYERLNFLESPIKMPN